MPCAVRLLLSYDGVQRELQQFAYDFFCAEVFWLVPARSSVVKMDVSENVIP